MLTRIILFICLFTSGFLFSQEFLQLETINDPETLKFGLRSKVTLRTKTNKDWQTIKLERLLFNDTVIVHTNGLLHLDEITDLRLNRPVVLALSRGAQTFGSAWLVYGSISGELFRNRVEWASIGFGVGSIIAGYLFKKAFYHRNVKLGSRYRLRLMDLRVY